LGVDRKVLRESFEEWEKVIDKYLSSVDRRN
jgi:hypothetical protein